MKNLKLLLSFALIISVMSCKKEFSEKDNLTSIQSSVVKKDIQKENFEKEVLPLVKELYQKDSVKYAMLNHIAIKASKEQNKAVFKMNVNNLKDELSFYKNDMKNEKK